MTEQQQDEAVALIDDRPADPAPTASPEPSIDDLLQQYESAVPKPETVTDNAAPNGQATDDSVEKFLSELSSDNQRTAQLEGELASLKNEVYRQQEAAAFNEYASQLQAKLPSHLEPNWARTQLLAKAAENPELEFAWRNRNVNRAQVDLEISKVEIALRHLQRDPNADPQKIAQLNNYGYRLGLAYNAKAIIQRAERDITKRVESYQPIDSDATTLKMEIAAAMRGASAKAIPELPTNWGKLSPNEGRKKVMEEFGFDPGWGH